MGRLLIAGIVLILVLLAAGWMSSRPKGTAQQQITDVIAQGQEALRSQNLSKALACVSDEYKGEGGTKDELRLLLIQAFRDSRSLKVMVDAPSIQVAGDTATAATRADVTQISQSGSDVRLATALTLRLRREPHKRYFIFPTREWRVVSADLKTGIQDFF